MFIETFNGFVGKGETQHQAKIAVAYAAAFLPLEGTDEEKTATYGNLPGWDGNEEACYIALTK